MVVGGRAGGTGVVGDVTMTCFLPAASVPSWLGRGGRPGRNGLCSCRANQSSWHAGSKRVEGIDQVGKGFSSVLFRSEFSELQGSVRGP
jgi:hypothetical protein